MRALFTGASSIATSTTRSRSHVQLRAEALERTGLSREAAIRAARMEFGGVTQLREAHRAERGVPWLEVVVRDLRLAVRTLRRDAGFTTFALLVMGLGLGGTATVYSLVNALMLRPLPLADAGRLAWVGNGADDGVGVWHIQANHLRDLQAQSRTFADLAGYYAYTQAGDLRVSERERHRAGQQRAGDAQLLRRCSASSRCSGARFTAAEAEDGKARAWS